MELMQQVRALEEVRAIINDELKEYSITITGRTDKSLTITGADIDLTYVDDNYQAKLWRTRNLQMD